MKYRILRTTIEAVMILGVLASVGLVATHATAGALPTGANIDCNNLSWNAGGNSPEQTLTDAQYDSHCK